MADVQPEIMLVAAAAAAPPPRTAASDEQQRYHDYEWVVDLASHRVIRRARRSRQDRP
jgi:hypothetical protein